MESKNADFRQILQLYIKNRSKENVLQAIAKLEQMDGVYSAEPNYLMEPAAVSNDPYFTNNSQWNLNGTGGINVPSAWDITTGSKSVRVGVIDSGIAHHPDLNDNLVQGRDFYNNDSITDDDEYGHGTQVAGIIGAVGNNAMGVAGINWNVTLVPLQVGYYDAQNKFYFSLSSINSAINYASELWGTEQQIDILNYSGSTFGNTPSMLNSIREFEGLFVWSAGNNGINVDEYNNINSYNLDNLISVGAIDKSNERSVWGKESSNYGNNVDIFAPGGKEFTANENIPTTNNQGSYSYFNGTSAAAPHVAGVAALILSINPTLTSADLKKLILDNADIISISTPDGKQDVKKLNAYEALSNTHKHSFIQFSSVDSNSHIKTCACGYSVTETHPYQSSYKKYDGTKHWAYCSCGERKLKAHVVSSDDHIGKQICILCKSVVDLGFVYPTE